MAGLSEVAEKVGALEEKFEQMAEQRNHPDQYKAMQRGQRAFGDPAARRETYSQWMQPEDGIRLGEFDFKGVMRGQLPEGYKPFTEFKSLSDFCREGIRDNDGFKLKHARAVGQFKAVQGMSEGRADDGGFLILPEFAPGIRDRVYQNDLLRLTDQYTVTGNRMAFKRNAETSRANGSRAGGLRGYWVDEGGTITSSAPKLAETELKLKKLAIVVYLTEELLNDNAYALEQYVSKKVSEEFGFMVSNAIMNGTGVGQPLGIANCPSVIEVAKETSQTADTVNTANIVKMFSRRLSVGDASKLVWLIQQSVEPELFRLGLSGGTSGGYHVFESPRGLANAPNGTLLGRPIIPIEFASAVGDAGDIWLANMGEYVTIAKGGISEAVSSHVQFLTDQLALRFILRIDGRPFDDSAITPYQAGATAAPTQSAFVRLAARA